MTGTAECTLPTARQPWEEDTQWIEVPTDDCLMVDAMYADAPLSKSEIIELQNAIEAGKGRPKITLQDLPID